MKFAIHTFGCRVNQADSFDIEEGLRARGGLEAPLEQADLIVVNTCTVTGAADQGARNFIRRAARLNPPARIVVTGCYATREARELAALPGVVAVVPNGAKDGLIGDVWPRHGGEGHCGTALEPGVMGRTAFPLRVQTGCDETCAFCVIPSTRGASRSKPVGEVLAEVERLAASGYRELWLVGVHLGSYGRDFTPPASLPDLLRALDRAPGDVSFRVSSLEPMDCTPEVIDLVAGSGRFMPHLHLPLQHGADRVLAAMRRPYSAACYRDLVESIRARLPHASIGADVMVGFPGESEADAEESARTVGALPLSYLHVFPYSDRPGTEASSLTPKVDPAAIKARASRMRAIGDRHASRFVASQAGTVRPGLTIDDGSIVLTDNFLKVSVPTGLPRNVRIKVRIEDGSGRAGGRVV